MKSVKTALLVMFLIGSLSAQQSGGGGASGGGGSSPLTTKGDIFAHSTVDARLPVGTDAYCLMADSTQTLGLKWASCGSGSMTWPSAAGLAVYGGSSSWGTSVKLGTLTDTNWCTYSTANGLQCTSAAPQVALALIKGTYTDGDWCGYAASGTLLHCDITPVSAYTLPAATSSTLGGVKPDGTTLTNSSGVISVTFGTASGTAAQGNDSRITGAFAASNFTRAGVVALWTTCVSGYLKYDGTCDIPSGAGTVTHTAGALTLNAAMFGNGTADSKVDTNITTDGSGNLSVVSVTAAGSPALTGTEGSAPSAPAATKHTLGLETTNGFVSVNSSNTKKYMVQVQAGTAHQFVTAIAATGVVTTAAIAAADLPTVTVPYGGTGLTTLTAHSVQVGEGTSTPAQVGPNAATTYPLFSAGSSADPAFRAIAAGDIPATAIPAVAVPTPGTSITLAGPSGFAICTGTCTVSVPVPVAGYQFCIMNDDNVTTAITLSALGSSARYENSARTAYGTAGTGTLVVAAAAADMVCIVGRDSTHYLTTTSSGAVTVN